MMTVVTMNARIILKTVTVPLFSTSTCPLGLRMVGSRSDILAREALLANLAIIVIIATHHHCPVHHLRLALHPQPQPEPLSISGGGGGDVTAEQITVSPYS